MSSVSLRDGKGRGAVPLCILPVSVWESEKGDGVEISLKDSATSLRSVEVFLQSNNLSLPLCLCLSVWSVCVFVSTSCQMQGESRCDDPRRDALLHMQAPVSMETTSPSPWSGHVEIRLGPCPAFEHTDVNPATRSLRRPGRRHSRSPPPPFRSCSIPIIPSVQCHHDNEVSCMQTSHTPASAAVSVTHGATVPRKDERREKAPRADLLSSFCSSAIGQQQQDEVALLLEEAQEQLRALALAHRKQEDSGIGSGGGSLTARETVCFLNLNGGSAGTLSCNGPTQTQLLSPSLSHRDLGPSGQ